ncbi:MAG: SDR family NAD(P)-dependent oxidoreductase, partial [Nitrosopumilaceae archaeon]
MKLKDKVAIVTGASSDIGFSIVKKFVEEGSQVVMIGRRLDSLKKAASALGNNSKQT